MPLGTHFFPLLRSLYSPVVLKLHFYFFCSRKWSVFVLARTRTCCVHVCCAFCTCEILKTFFSSKWCYLQVLIHLICYEEDTPAEELLATLHLYGGVYTTELERTMTSTLKHDYIPCSISLQASSVKLNMNLPHKIVHGVTGKLSTCSLAGICQACFICIMEEVLLLFIKTKGKEKHHFLYIL